MLVNVGVKVGEAHALEDECYLELLGTWRAGLLCFLVSVCCYPACTGTQ